MRYTEGLSAILINIVLGIHELPLLGWLGFASILFEDNKGFNCGYYQGLNPAGLVEPL
jgi:hypothetical protein